MDDVESDENNTGKEIDAGNATKDGERLDYSGSENDDPIYEPQNALTRSNDEQILPDDEASFKQGKWEWS